MQPRVAVAILAVGNADLLAASLDSITRHGEGEPPHQVVLVLNDATDAVREVARRHAPDAVIIDSPVNLGTGGGFNRAFAATDAPFLFIAHDDSEVTAGWLSPLVARMDEEPALGAVGGRIDSFDGRVQTMGAIAFRDGSTHPEWAGGDAPAELVGERRDVDYHGGLGLLIRREAWQAVGGFDDVAFYPGYYVDADFCFRLRAAGWRVQYEPSSVLRHHWGRSTTPAFQRFIIDRNRQAFARRHEAELTAHGEPAPGDPDAVAAEVHRRRRSAGPGNPVTPADDGVAEVLRERLRRTDAEYLRHERDIWRQFASGQTAAREHAEANAAAFDASRRSWQHTARAVGDDRDRWRARAAALSANAEDVAARLAATSDALERTTSALGQATASRWWRLGERLRRLRP